MENRKATSPIGLSAIKRVIENVCAHPDAYHRYGMAPGHYIVNLDAGNGQTTLTSYISDMFMSAGVRHFGGLDLFLEYRLDGTMQQLKRVLGNIKACAVYTNEYEGVIAIDISGLAPHINETQTTLFLDEVKKTAASATMVFYVPSIPSRNTAALVKRLQEAVETVSVVTVQPYTQEALSEIVMAPVEDSGVEAERSAEMQDAILQAITADEVKTVKDAKRLISELVKLADFKQFTPQLTAAAIGQAMDYPREVR